MDAQQRSQLVKQKALELGFLYCGISKATFLEEEAPRLETWLQQGRQGKMSYMENYFDKRLDPRLLVDGARSVISLALNYYNPARQSDPSAPLISMYAWGKDYHTVLKDKMASLSAWMQDEFGDLSLRAFVDSAPVMDKAWATRSGLGWQGKHTNLINKKGGSYFFLAEIITDLELAEDGPARDHCGSCTRCIDACPTEAITEAYVLDASKCISYLTIELKEEIPAEFKGQMENWAFGCDICQQVCPWNRFSVMHTEPEFMPLPGLLEKTAEDWHEITEELFKSIFKDSPIKRTKFTGLRRNLDFLT